MISQARDLRQKKCESYGPLEVELSCEQA